MYTSRSWAPLLPPEDQFENRFLILNNKYKYKKAYINKGDLPHIDTMTTKLTQDIIEIMAKIVGVSISAERS